MESDIKERRKITKSDCSSNTKQTNIFGEYASSQSFDKITRDVA